MARDVMTVRLHLPQIRVLEVVEDTPGALVVSVESTLLRLRCAQCGFKCRRVHDRRAKRVRDLEVSGRKPISGVLLACSVELVLPKRVNACVPVTQALQLVAYTLVQDLPRQNLGIEVLTFGRL